MPKQPERPVRPEIEAELAVFREHLRDLDYRPRTVEYYATGITRVHALAEEAMGERIGSLHDLIPRDVAQARDAFIGRGRAASSANWLVTSGRAWGTFIGKAEAFEQIRPVQTGWHPLDALSDIQYNRLLRTLDRDAIPKAVRNKHDNALRDRAMFALTLGCALRLDESLDVRVRHLRLGPQSGWVRVIGKGLKERESPVPEPFRQMLRERVDELMRDAGDRRDPEDMLILGGLGESGADKAMRRWGRRAGLTIAAHMLRRTRGRRWRYKDKIPIETVARWLGHESVETTRRYTEDPNVGAQTAMGGPASPDAITGGGQW